MDNKAAAPQKPAVPQNVILEDRSRLTVTGVRRMLSCDENGASMETARGILAVTGRELSVSALSLETGEVRFSGKIEALNYTDTNVSAGGFWKRLVR